jgi:excisionase family DNA binding protein
MSTQSDKRPIGRQAHSINEAAALIGIGRDGVYRAINERRLRARKYGKRTLILATDLQAFLDARCRFFAIRALALLSSNIGQVTTQGRFG